MVVLAVAVVVAPVQVRAHRADLADGEEVDEGVALPGAGASGVDVAGPEVEDALNHGAQAPAAIASKCMLARILAIQERGA